MRGLELVINIKSQLHDILWSTIRCFRVTGDEPTSIRTGDEPFAPGVICTGLNYLLGIHALVVACD